MGEDLHSKKLEDGQALAGLKGKTIMKRHLSFTVVLLFSAAILGIVRAALLVVNPMPPLITYSNSAVTATTYNPVSQIFSVSATPSGIQFSLSETVLSIAAPRSLSDRKSVV